LRVIVGVVGVTSLVVLSGCSADLPRRQSTPRPVASESASALLDDAIDVYTRYSAALDVILAAGEGDFTALKGIGTEAFYDAFATSEDEFTKGIWRTDGSTSFDSVEVMQASDTEITLGLCRDVSRVRIVDEDGNDATPVDRPDRFRVRATFIKTSAGELRIDSIERNAEDPTC
jgi:hypothetical protein